MEKIEAIRQAGKINAEAIKYGIGYSRAGQTLKELDEAIGKYIREQGANPSFLGYNGFPGNCCLSVNEVAVHGIPNEYKLQKGDLLTVDCGTHFEGYHADSAVTFLIDTYINDLSEDLLEKQKLIRCTRLVLRSQLRVIKNDCTLLDIALAGENMANKLAINIIPRLGGHRIGEQIHEEPFIPMTLDRTKSNLGQKLEREKYENYVFKAGDFICIEPVCTFGDGKVYKDSDGWSIKTNDKSYVAHVEHTILITEKGFEILT